MDRVVFFDHIYFMARASQLQFLVSLGEPLGQGACNQSELIYVLPSVFKHPSLMCLVNNTYMGAPKKTDC